MRVSHYTPMQNRPKSSPIKNPRNVLLHIFEYRPGHVTRTGLSLVAETYPSLAPWTAMVVSKSDHITSNPSKKGWSMGMGTAEAVLPLCEHSQRKCFCALHGDRDL